MSRRGYPCEAEFLAKGYLAPGPHAVYCAMSDLGESAVSTCTHPSTPPRTEIALETMGYSIGRWREVGKLSLGARPSVESKRNFGASVLTDIPYGNERYRASPSFDRTAIAGQPLKATSSDPPSSHLPGNTPYPVRANTLASGANHGQCASHLLHLDNQRSKCRI
jgi:hypothetical protein